MCRFSKVGITVRVGSVLAAVLCFPSGSLAQGDHGGGGGCFASDPQLPCPGITAPAIAVVQPAAVAHAPEPRKGERARSPAAHGSR